MRKVKIVNVPADFTNIINLQISSLIFALRFFGVKTAKEKKNHYIYEYIICFINYISKESTCTYVIIRFTDVSHTSLQQSWQWCWEIMGIH